MQGFYNLTNKIRETLQLDQFVSTVTYGDLFEIDLNKQTIFPLSHFMVTNATMQSNVWNFSVSVLCMDIVDESKEFPDGIPQEFRGTSNEQDVLNTQFAVANRLLELLLRGDLYVEKYQLSGDPSLEPFVDRFENKLAGWTVTFNILIPNDMTIC
jgi:hypothetical protein|tara:strand:+ start:1209 stop:1673 length:465 start_codon:yes stop_codon:yes gene_type:complete